MHATSGLLDKGRVYASMSQFLGQDYGPNSATCIQSLKIDNLFSHFNFSTRVGPWYAGPTVHRLRRESKEDVKAVLEETVEDVFSPHGHYIHKTC